MNAINFKGNDEIKIPSFMYEKPRRTQKPLPQEPQYDTFEPSNTKRKKSNTKKPFIIITSTGTLLGLLAGMYIGNPIKTKPVAYDYIQTKIDNSQDPTEIEALLLKQEKQKEVATGYKDGKFVYYTINPSSEDTPNYINIEEFKELFDIKDNQLRKYNELKQSYIDTEPDPSGHRGMFGYDSNFFYENDLIKVPISGIDTENINLDDYYTLSDDEYTIIDENDQD